MKLYYCDRNFNVVVFVLTMLRKEVEVFVVEVMVVGVMEVGVVMGTVEKVVVAMVVAVGLQVEVASVVALADLMVLLMGTCLQTT